MTYEWVDHTAEVELYIEAEREEDVFAEAVTAFAEVAADDGSGDRLTREVEVSGGDRAELLVALLEELIYLAEVEDFVPERLEGVELPDDVLRARVAGHTGRPSPLVKAVTYHRLEFDCDGDRCRARVVLDV